MSKILFKRLSISAIAAGLGSLAYDGAVNDGVYSAASIRFLRSLKAVALISKDYYIALNKNVTDSTESSLNKVHLKSAERILDVCLKNGGLYIKIGQGVAAINHILPVEYTETLSLLQDKCLLSQKIDVQKVFLEEFNDLPENIFKDFNYEAVASASLAQVFRAKLESGEEVAVKVQYADLDKRFHSDIGTLIFLQNMIEYFFKNYNFGWILTDLKQNLEMELDFINEAKNSEKCYKEIKHLENVYVPKVYWKHTKKRILTMEWIEGFKITELNLIKKYKIDLKSLDAKLFEIFCEQIFNTGFVHADPHPGNLFVRSQKSGQFDIVILDHGLYEYLPKNNRKSLCTFWEATILKDESKMKSSAKSLNIDHYKDLAEVLLQAPFEMKFFNFQTKLSDVDIVYMQNMAKNHFDSVMQTLKSMPRSLLLVIRNLNTIRAISKEHGDPIDRQRVMARFAQKYLWQRNTFKGFFLWMYHRIMFEFSLLRLKFQFSIAAFYIDVMHMIGKSSQTSNEFFENWRKISSESL